MRTKAAPESYHRVGAILAKVLIEHGQGFSESVAPTSPVKGLIAIPESPNHTLEVCMPFAAEIRAGRDQADARQAAKADYHDRGLTTDFEAAWAKANQLVATHGDVIDRVARQCQGQKAEGPEVRKLIDDQIGDLP